LLKGEKTDGVNQIAQQLLLGNRGQKKNVRKTAQKNTLFRVAGKTEGKVQKREFRGEMKSWW